MAKRGPQYLVDDKGRKKGVLLSMKQYSELMQRLEDLEVALELDEAIRTEDSFRNYEEIRKELKDKQVL